MELPRSIRVAGTSFCQTNIRKVRAKAFFVLQPEPDNTYDPDAILVMAYGKFKVGYVPARIAEELLPMLEDGRAHNFADFVRANVSGKHETQGLTIKIRKGAHYE